MLPSRLATANRGTTARARSKSSVLVGNMQQPSRVSSRYIATYPRTNRRVCSQNQLLSHLLRIYLTSIDINLAITVHILQSFSVVVSWYSPMWHGNAQS
jgi:hypothetical protein